MNKVGWVSINVSLVGRVGVMVGAGGRRQRRHYREGGVVGLGHGLDCGSLVGGWLRGGPPASRSLLVFYRLCLVHPSLTP